VIPQEIIDRVRETTDIVETVSRYVSLKSSGRSYKGLCPFHQEKTPSFIVNPERQIFKCFGCGAGSLQDFGRIRPAIVVHATPVGMAGDPRSLLSPGDLDPSMTVFDLVYTPAETPLLRAAAARGCLTIPGTEMFVYQACEQFLHMTGIAVEPGIVREVLEK